MIASTPISRLSQPSRLVEPGFASSSCSIAEKCDRFRTGSPEAWTAATLPELHNGSSGAIAGCRPKKASLATSVSAGTAIRGRAW